MRGDRGISTSSDKFSHLIARAYCPHAYGWRGSALASQRLREAVSEIKTVAKSDRVLAGEGVVSLMERLWPARELIDTSSGALGGAVHHTLGDLIRESGKWFAAAKEEGFLEVAVSCARDVSVEPATLVRAARDFAVEEPRCAAEIGLVALQRLLDGSGYDPTVSLVHEALDHLLDGASRIGARDWAKERAQSLVDAPRPER